MHAHRLGHDRSSGPHESEPLSHRISHLESLPPSPRERQVWELAAIGATRREIARELRISPATVRSHMANLHVKTQTHTLGELIAVYYHAVPYRWQRATVDAKPD